MSPRKKINVKPTKQHKVNIKKHKKIFEKWDMWDFAYFDGKEYYFLTVYNSLFGKVTGYLLLDKSGKEPDVEKVKEAAYYLICYNTLVHNVITGMVPRMNMNMAPYQQMVKLLAEHKKEIVRADPELEGTVERIIALNKIIVEEASQVREIVYTVGGLQREITRGSGFFDQEFLQKMEEEAGRYSFNMYTFGLREREMQPGYQRIYQLISKGRVKAPRLRALLKAAIETNEKELEASMSTFERDQKGNPLQIDRENIPESLVYNRQMQGQKDFDELIMPIIRNFHE
ncbi:hypothetical protein D3H55_20050 [Bacillus salacetis]|uniref:Uncharacterized protein n=2 Tax=Bacillus salacetis TaxID=2315464 RepID=A0A3A1QRA6_9BACI|nr:hypothetical protein D3H55_20050 [Bacillus salacetis]